MRKLLATILLLSACCVVKVNGFVIKIAERVFFEVAMESFMRKISGESVEHFLKEVPVFVFSSTRAVAFSSLSKVPNSVLYGVVSNKLSIGYKIAEEFHGEAISNLSWKACREIDTRAIGATSMELIDQYNAEAIRTTGRQFFMQADIKGVPLELLHQERFSLEQVQSIQKITKQACKDAPDVIAIKGFFNRVPDDFDKIAKKASDESWAALVEKDRLADRFKNAEKLKNASRNRISDEAYNAIKDEYDRAVRAYDVAKQRCNEIEIVETRHKSIGRSLKAKIFTKSLESPPEIAAERTSMIDEVYRSPQQSANGECKCSPCCFIQFAVLGVFVLIPIMLAAG